MAARFESALGKWGAGLLFAAGIGALLTRGRRPKARRIFTVDRVTESRGVGTEAADEASEVAALQQTICLLEGGNATLKDDNQLLRDRLEATQATTAKLATSHAELEAANQALQANYLRRFEAFTQELERLGKGETTRPLTGVVDQTDDDDDDYLHVQCYAGLQSAGAVAEILDSTAVGTLPYDRVVVTIPSDALMTSALQMLGGGSCLRVTADGQELGVLNVVDAAVFLLQREFAVVAGEPIARALRACGSVGPLTTLRSAVRYFARGYDYITVRGKSDCLVSQASVLRFLHQHHASGAGRLPDLQAADCLIGRTAEVMTRPADDPVRRTLRHMISNEIRAVSLMRDKNVVAVLSLSDVKCVAATDNLAPLRTELLDKSAVEFLRISRRNGRPVNELVACGLETPVDQVLELMVTAAVHTVVVLDDGRYAGTVTTASLLSGLVR
jgi:CBS domain-containing protein